MMFTSMSWELVQSKLSQSMATLADVKALTHCQNLNIYVN